MVGVSQSLFVARIYTSDDLSDLYLISWSIVFTNHPYSPKIWHAFDIVKHPSTTMTLLANSGLHELSYGGLLCVVLGFVSARAHESSTTCLTVVMQSLGFWLLCCGIHL